MYILRRRAAHLLQFRPGSYFGRTSAELVRGPAVGSSRLSKAKRFVSLQAPRLQQKHNSPREPTGMRPAQPLGPPQGPLGPQAGISACRLRGTTYVHRYLGTYLRLQFPHSPIAASPTRYTCATRCARYVPRTLHLAYSTARCSSPDVLARFSRDDRSFSRRLF